MHAQRARLPCTIASLLVGLGAAPGNAGVVLRFTGTVLGVTDVGAAPPAVKVGRAVEGTITYEPSAATAFVSGPREMSYRFPADPGHVFRLAIGNQTWTVPLQVVSVCDEGCGGDVVKFAGPATGAADFPGFLYRGEMLLQASTWAPPHALVTGLRLPAAAADIDFGVADFRRGEILSSMAAQFRYWYISFSMDAAALPVRATTWGAIKALYATAAPGPS